MPQSATIEASHDLLVCSSRISKADHGAISGNCGLVEADSRLQNARADAMKSSNTLLAAPAVAA